MDNKKTGVPDTTTMMRNIQNKVFKYRYSHIFPQLSAFQTIFYFIITFTTISSQVFSTLLTLSCQLQTQLYVIPTNKTDLII